MGLSYYQCLDKMIYGLVEALSNLVAVCKTTHARHYAEHVVVGSVNADLGGLGTLNSCVGKHKLKGGVINTREVARSRWLVLLRAKCEGVHVDTSVWVASVVLVRLYKVEVGTLTLRESVLAVKLKLSSHDRVLTPAVHVKGSLGKDESTSIRYSGHITTILLGELWVAVLGTAVRIHSSKVVGIPEVSLAPVIYISGTGILEKTRSVNV